MFKCRICMKKVTYNDLMKPKRPEWYEMLEDEGLQFEPSQSVCGECRSKGCCRKCSADGSPCRNCMTHGVSNKDATSETALLCENCLIYCWRMCA